MIKLIDLINENETRPFKEVVPKYVYPLAMGKDRQSYEGNEGWKGKIVYMSPDKFLRLASPLPSYDARPESMANIEHRIKNGLPLDYCVLEIDMKRRRVTSHEGRHRAMVSRKLGIESIPVLIFTGSNFKRVPQWDAEDHADIEKMEFKPEAS